MSGVPLGRPQRRRAIHRAASALLSERGFYGFTMRDVARLSRQSLSNLYHYVADREDLVYQTLRQILEAAAASAEATQVQSGAKERLRALVTDHMQRVMAAPVEAALLRGDPLPLPEPQRRRIEQLRQDYLESVRRTVDDLAPGRRRATSERRAKLLLGLADRAALDARAEGLSPPRLRRLVSDVLELFLEGSQAPSQRSS